MLEFTEITDTEDPHFEEAMAIYVTQFPKNERHPVTLIRERVQRGSNKLYVGRITNEVVFVALLWPLDNTDFILLDYMATKETHQSRGIGSSFMKNMRNLLTEKQKRFVIEVEVLKHDTNKRERERRLSFYKRVGAQEMKDVKYILPGLDGGEPTEMILMLFPSYDGSGLTGEAVKNLLIQIYRELYNRDQDDVLLNSFLNTVGDRVELI